MSFRKVNPDRLAALDGMRGLAAIAVALMHGNSIFNLGWIPAHAYLAVDFFFLLSGYVFARCGWAYDFVSVFALFPALLVLATTTQAGGLRLQSLCRVFGELSYPLYAIHMPFFLMVAGISAGAFSLSGRIAGMTISRAAVAILSWCLALCYDQPARRWAVNRFDNPIPLAGVT